MEMEKKNLAIIILAIVLAASGVGNIILGIQLGFLEVLPPARGQDLVYGPWQGDIVDLDPHYAYDSASYAVQYQVVEPLYQYNISDPDYPILPWLASGMPTISPDGTEYTIPLRQGIVFHDNDTLPFISKFNATAVKWTFDRLCHFQNKSGNADLPAPFNVSLPLEVLPTQLGGAIYEQPDGKRVINKTEVISEYVVKVTLNQPKGSFFNILAFLGCSIMSPHSTPPNRYLYLYEKLVGTGPFEYISFTAGVEVKMEGFDDYWGTPENTGPPQLDTLTYVLPPDAVTMANGFLAGDIDIILSVTGIETFIPTFEANPNIDGGFYGATWSIVVSYFNYDHINLTMRKALSYCFNYSYMIETIAQGVALRLGSPIPAGIPYSNYSFDYPTYDVAKAREFLLNDSYYGPILAGAGITGASPDSAWLNLAATTPLETLNISYNIGNLVRQGAGDRLAFDAPYIGVSVTSFGVIWGDYLTMIVLERERMDMYTLGWHQDYIDPENFITPLYSNTSAINGGNFYEPDVQALMDQGLVETDPVQREWIYDEIQRLMIEEYCTSMWLYSGLNYDYWWNYVDGWIPNSIMEWFYTCSIV
jgi:peptide/nickel transport system substrate-binding protein